MGAVLLALVRHESERVEDSVSPVGPGTLVQPDSHHRVGVCNAHEVLGEGRIILPVLLLQPHIWL